MVPSIKRDLKISIAVGVAAGILMAPTLNNIGIVMNFKRGLAIALTMAVFTPLGYLIAYWLSRWWPIMLQFVKFGIIGGLNAMIDLGVLNLLIHYSGIAAGSWYSVFKSVSFCVAVVNSYFWNKYWTFRSESGVAGVEFTKFFLVNFLAFALNVGGASLLVNLIGAPEGFPVKLWANVGAISMVFISMFVNFIGMKFIVFKK